MTARSATMMFRDAEAAKQFAKMNDMGRYPKEMVVYALAYYKDDKRHYMITATEDELIHFVMASENRAYYPTPILKYSQRLHVPKGYEEDIYNSLKLSAAQILQRDYPDWLFAELMAIDQATPYSNAVDDIFEQALESMEGVFALDRVNVFGELAAAAHQYKKLSRLAYAQIMNWCVTRRTHLESYIPPAERTEKGLYAFAVLDESMVKDVYINACLSNIYEQRITQQAMGRLVTPLLKKVYSCEQYKTIGEMKKQMHKDASALFDGLFRKLIYSTACQPSPFADAGFAHLASRAEAAGAAAAKLIHYYGQLWGIPEGGQP